MRVKVVEVPKPRTLMRDKFCAVSVCEVGSSQVYVFENSDRDVVLMVYPGGVDAFQVIGGSFSKIENSRVTVEALKSMGFNLGLLPKQARKALAIHSIL